MIVFLLDSFVPPNCNSNETKKQDGISLPPRGVPGAIGFSRFEFRRLRIRRVGASVRFQFNLIKRTRSSLKNATSVNVRRAEEMIALSSMSVLTRTRDSLVDADTRSPSLTPES
jgi:hypothetical protein